MQLALGVARIAEWFQQLRAFAEQLTGDQLAHTDHLEAMIRIGNDVDVVAEPVEHREAVRREASDATGWFLSVEIVPPLEALLAERKRGSPHIGEVIGHHELR